VRCLGRGRLTEAGGRCVFEAGWSTEHSDIASLLVWHSSVAAITRACRFLHLVHPPPSTPQRPPPHSPDPVQRHAREQLQRARLPHDRHGELHQERRRHPAGAHAQVQPRPPGQHHHLARGDHLRRGGAGRRGVRGRWWPGLCGTCGARAVGGLVWAFRTSGSGCWSDALSLSWLDVKTHIC